MKVILLILMLNTSNNTVFTSYTGPYVSYVECRDFAEQVLQITRKNPDLKKNPITLTCVSKMEI